MEEKVGFLAPDNRMWMMNYHEVEDFCKNICFSDEYRNMFDNFKRDYSYFNPYFDFVMIVARYIFINPLLEKDTFLMSFKNRFFKVEKSELEGGISTNYETISEVALKKKNGQNYAHLVACSDIELNIKKVSLEETFNCMIDPNGYAMITTSDEPEGNHEITANTIINQLLICSKNFEKRYSPDIYAVNYLVGQFGFIRATSFKYGGLLIGVERFLTPTQKQYCDMYVKKGGTFLDICNEEKMSSIITEQKEDYKRR